MALSDRELRLLAEMEQALSADDPALVSTLTGARRRGPGAGLGAAALIIGIATLFGGLIAQATLVGDALENGLLAVRKAAEGVNPVLNPTNHVLVQPTGTFLPVAGDERDGVLFVEQADYRLDLLLADL